MQTGKAVMWWGINSNKFATWPKDTPDPFIRHIKNPLKLGLGKKLSWVYYFRHKALIIALVDP